MGRNSETQKFISSKIILPTANPYIFSRYLVHLQAGLIKNM